MDKDIKLELKVVPVDSGGFIVKTYDGNADLRTPTQTRVCKNLSDLTKLIKELYVTR